MPKNHKTNTVYLGSGGRMRIVVDGTRCAVNGTYEAVADKVCATLPVRGRNCWPHDATAVEGMRQDVTSDRGQAIAIGYPEQGTTVASLSQETRPAVALATPVAMPAPR